MVASCRVRGKNKSCSRQEANYRVGPFQGGGVQKLNCSSFNFYISTLKLYGQKRIIALKEKLVSK